MICNFHTTIIIYIPYISQGFNVYKTVVGATIILTDI